MKHRPPLITPSDLVTDHAVLRWLERVSGLDVRGPVVESMLGEGRAAMVQSIKYGQIRIAGTEALLVVENSRVVTVLTHGDTRTPRGARHRR